MVARARLHKFGGRSGRAASATATLTGGGNGHAWWRARDHESARVALPASALSILRAIAKNAAKTNGDWRPAVVTAVPTTHGQALSCAPGGATAPLADDGVAYDTPVYLVTMTGHFTGDEAGDPTGGPAGRYLSLVVHARSFWIMGSGLSRKPPPIRPATLGPVTNIAW